MIYSIDNGKIERIKQETVELNGTKRYWGVFSLNQVEEVCRTLHISKGFLTGFLLNPATRFESHDGFDVICYNVIKYAEKNLPVKRVCIYIRKDLVLMLAENPEVVSGIVEEIAEDVEKTISFERLFHTFLERTIMDDASFLDDIEQEIAELEDQLITTNRKNCVIEIISLRKKLMQFKRHYEQMQIVLDAVQENENELIDPRSMRYFKIFANRVDRLYHIVLNLRDYVTQVREAYQAEVDINLNSIMKLFTVITAIFLPLTLIVGWYGMNLQLPEYGWRYGYLMVILISAAVVAFCLFYFKRHNWFK